MDENKAEEGAKRPTPLFPEIIIKFQEGGLLEDKEGQLYAEHLSLEGFNSTLQSVKGAEVRRSFPSDPRRQREMQLRASKRLKRKVPSMNLFVRVRLTQDIDNVDALVKEFAADPEIEYAVRASIPANPPSPDFRSNQDYLDTINGVNAPFAWSVPNGDGTGVRVCDCEYGFNPNHEDLPAISVVSNRDGDLNQSRDHGTAVTGILAGKMNNSQGVTGICYGATMLFASESGGHRTECIDDAISQLNLGDVLLLEMQGLSGSPAEYDPDIHTFVTNVTGDPRKDIVVVAAAGDGGVNLATLSNENSKNIWNPTILDYDDSGAIIVGAGHSSSSPLSRVPLSTYGDRVDCQGWGEGVVTTGYGNFHNGGPNAMYTNTFSDTSSAAAMVAGVVACLQGAYKHAHPGSFLPAVPDPDRSSVPAIRDLLRDPTNGTPQSAADAASHHIGPLPDLRKLLKAVGILPKVTPAITAASKPYDSTTTATITCTLTGVLAGDVGNVGCTWVSASFTDGNVGTGKTVTATGLSLTGSAAGNYVLSSTSATTTADIMAVTVTPAITAASKPYDGNNTATILTRTLGGMLAGDAANVSLTGGTATFSDASVGNGKTVTATGLSLTGSAWGNYVLSSTSATATADITPVGVPDVYIRDFVGDTGDPHTGAISASPDVILRQTAVVNPLTSFGEGSGTENSATLGFEAKAGQDNFIYVRVKNRGGSPAVNVNADVYWSPPSTLLTPPWGLAGSTIIANVPGGDKLTVSNAITWNSVPATGHYCFVALIGNAQDPAPAPAAFLNWNNYQQFIRANNNVTWRNFNVVSNVPAAPSRFVILPFLAAGAPDKARRMQLEVVARLPKGAEAMLEIRRELAKLLTIQPDRVKDSKNPDAVLMALKPSGRTPIADMLVEAKARIPMQLLVHIPEELRKYEFEIFAHQLYEKEEVGRVTWRLAPPRKPPH